MEGMGTLKKLFLFMQFFKLVNEVETPDKSIFSILSMRSWFAPSFIF